MLLKNENTIKLVEIAIPNEYKAAYGACKFAYTVATTARRLYHHHIDERRLIYHADFGGGDPENIIDDGGIGSYDMRITDPNHPINLVNDDRYSDPWFSVNTIESRDNPADPERQEILDRYQYTQDEVFGQERHIHGAGYVTINPDPRSSQQLFNQLDPDHLREGINDDANHRMIRHGREIRDTIAQHSHDVRDRIGHRRPNRPQRVYCRCPTLSEMRTTVENVSTRIGDEFRRIGEILSECPFPIEFPFWG